MFTLPTPGDYAPTKMILKRMEQEGWAALHDKWIDEASEAALAGNPRKAQYLAYMATRI